MKTIILGLSVLVFYSNCLSQDLGNLIMTHQVDANKLRTTAAISLKEYVSNFLNNENIQRFGFSSIEEAKNSKIGDPIQVLMIGLTDIQKFEKGSDPKTLLINIDTWWFPVLTDNVIKTKIEIIERDGKMVPGEFGGIKLVSSIMNSRQELLNRLKERSLAPTKEIAIVKIPALMIVLLLTEVDNTLYAVPSTGSIEFYGLRQNELVRLDEALLRIKVVASKVDPKKTM
jgi:hypothetical protein